ncbi:fluoride efflux transporter CrcB [Luteimonas composti]|uniref:Fluoride-specific ion channel FluC n=1 Tax=Luteimonas composti TaxID=398257 RepID=A0ABT6MVD4_9GAMM|nr:fluoride efflux transporter CrcB [Luteimonas composti]MDH7454553.1 fluoride efflux transporter CrcB [Luteimonas composti]
MASTPAALALVAAGGAAGSLARYLLSAWTMQPPAAQKFPLGTLLVNLAGCLGAGLLAGLAERQAGWLDEELRLLLFVGVLGGFTTFSAFGLETVQLLRRGEWLLAGGYVGASVLLGLGLIALGIRLAAP